MRGTNQLREKTHNKRTYKYKNNMKDFVASEFFGDDDRRVTFL
jgi:hypothetical protein